MKLGYGITKAADVETCEFFRVALVTLGSILLHARRGRVHGTLVVR